MRSWLLTLPILATLSWGKVGHAAPEDTGPYAVAVSGVAIPGKDVSIATDVYMPTPSAKLPVVALRHAQTRAKETLAGWGKLLASHGYVVLVPNSRNSAIPDPDHDGGDMVSVVEWAIADETIGPHIDGTKRIFGGVTSGATAALVAASRMGASALILWDADKVAAAETLAADLSVPTLAYISDANNCNGSGAGIATFQSLAGPRFGFRMPGSHFCDVENPSDNVCALLCGGLADAAHFNRIARYTVSFIDAHAKCDASAFDYVNGPLATADTSIKILTETKNIQIPPATCPQPLPEAGPDETTDAEDAEVPPPFDSGVPPPVAQNPPYTITPPTQSDDSVGCACNHAGAIRGFPIASMAAWAAFGASLYARRRKKALK